MSLSMFQILEKVDKSRAKSKRKKTMRHNTKFNMEFYDVIKDTYYSRRFKDSGGLTSQATASCDACGTNPSCLAVKYPERASVVNGLRPLIVPMKLVALVHARDKRVTYSMAYSIIVTILLWLNFMRYFLAYTEQHQYGTKLFFRITMHVWYGQTAVVSTIYYFGISPKLPNFLRKWNDFVYQHHCRTGPYIQRVAVRNLVIGTGIITIAVTIAVVAMIFEEGSDMFSAGSNVFSAETKSGVLWKLENPNIYLKVLFLVANTYSAIAWMLPTALVVSICVGIRKNFQNLTFELKKSLKDDHKQHNGIEVFRCRHQKLCRLVRDLDLIFSLYNLSIYITCIPLLCFVIYNFAFHAYDGHLLLMLLVVVQLFLIVCQIAVVTMAASSVSMQATAAADELFDLKLEGIGFEKFHMAIQVSIFLQRVTTSHIGLTAWHLFNINRATLLTITTMILSYVFVLIKFGLTLERKNGSAEKLDFIMSFLKNSTCYNDTLSLPES